jgi:hypothetical protein
MPPRRKKAADETDVPVTGETPASSTPKKRAIRPKKAAPTVLREEPLPSVLPPTKPIEPPRPLTPETPPSGGRVLPINMKIEPASPPAVDRWTPRPTVDSELSMPPKVLLQSRKLPMPEVEDILEEPPEESHRENFIRPPVRTGLYKKLGIGFAAVAAIVLLLVGYVTLSKATITVYPKKIEVKSDRTVAVAAEPQDDEVAGEIIEISVAGEKTTVPTGAEVKDAVATGVVTLVNETGSPITLVPTTRLLSPENVLFRLKDRAAIPAGGTSKAAVYADQPGKAGEVGPSRFTIPGLTEAQQKVIYGKSDAAMTGGTAGKGGTATQEDLDRLEKELCLELAGQARDEIAAKTTGEWNAQELLAKIPNGSRFVNVAPGETTDKIVVRRTLSVVSVGFNKERVLEVAAEDLKKRGLTSEMELSAVRVVPPVPQPAVDPCRLDPSWALVEQADPKTGTASLHVDLVGETNVGQDNPIFEADKLKSKSLDEVREYFEGIEGVERIDVSFFPFWNKWFKRMPTQGSHIKVIFNQ